MKLSIVILCWNDRKVIGDCLKSIYSTTISAEFEVIVSDNGSSDGSVEFIRSAYKDVMVIENRENLRFAKGNNVGICASRGDYVLILNPDTLIHDGTLDRIVSFADAHPRAGAFGCRVLNSDGSYQVSARPFASLRGDLLAALCLRGLGNVHRSFTADGYPGWMGTTMRTVDWLSGCFILVRGEILREIDGFDEQFFYYYEDMDLCRRIWDSGYEILYLPNLTITHLGGQSTKNRFTPLPYAIESQTTRYLYYYKYYGRHGVLFARRIALLSGLVRSLGYWVKQALRPSDAGRQRYNLHRSVFKWNYGLDPMSVVLKDKRPRCET